jgi:L-lactate dehydrogenase complex protein LldF
VLYRLFLWGATRFGWMTPKNVGPWTRNHSAPVPARRSLHDLAREHLDKGGQS